MADGHGQQQEQRPRHQRCSHHRRDDRRAPDQGQRQAQAPKARRDNAAGRVAGLHIVDNAPCPMHPGARHTWGECWENARNCANNNKNRNNAQGAGGGQRRSRQQPQQRGEAQGHFVETINSTMEQEDVSELLEDLQKSPILLLWSKTKKNSSSLMSRLPVQPQQNPSLLSPLRPLLLRLTLQVGLLWCITPGPHNGVLSFVPPAQATQLLLHSQWGQCKPPSTHTVSRKKTPKLSAAPVKKAPPVAAPQPPPKDETPAPLETGNGEYLLPVFHFDPFGTAIAMQETHHLDLFSFTDSFLEQSLDPYGISMGSTMFPSTVLLQPIDEPIPSYQTIMTRSCTSSGSVLISTSANKELKWPEASWSKPSCTGKYGKVTMSQSGSTSYTKPVGITALMSYMPPQPCKRSKNTILRPTRTKATYGTTSKRMISVTPSRMSWTLSELEDVTMSIDCFTSTTKKVPCCHSGNATTNSILKRGPKRARTSSRRLSFHSKTPVSIATKSMQSSIISAKKPRTRSDSDPSKMNLRKLSTSTTCSRSTAQNAGPEPRLPNHTDQGPLAPPMMELPTEQQTACSSTRQRNLLTPNCQPLPCLTPLTESELQGLCASILTETFPEVCVTDAVALQWRDPNSKTFSPSSQLVPISLATVHQFSGVSSLTPLVVLFDCGSQLSFLKRSKVPKKCEISTIEQPVRDLTGTSHLTEEVTLTGITLTEFSTSKCINSSLCCLLLDEQQEDSTYDMILGLDFLCALGIDILCHQKQLRWDDATLAFQPRDMYKETHMNLHACTVKAFTYGNEEDDPEGLGYKSTQIMEAKYEAIDTDELAQLQKQLTLKQRTDLAHLFCKFPQLFDSKLCMYPHHQYHLDLQDSTKPVHSCPYGVLFTQWDAFKCELDHLVKIGILEHSGASQWASGTFSIPKKDGCVRWISDFCALNKCIKRKTYPLPHISEILSKRTGYAYFSKLDISMAYYTFELDDESKDLCTINTPYGLYRYRVLPLGISQSPDFCQETMEHILQGIMDADVYIDDIGCFGESWEQHLQVLEQVVIRLQDNGFSVNPCKCEWAVQETDFLGYWLTRNGLKPWRKKIDAILQLQHPCMVKDLRSFIGAVTYYCTMFPKRAHILALLTALTSQKSGMLLGLLNVSRFSTLSRRFCPRTCFFAIPTTTNHSMSILMLATSS